MRDEALGKSTTLGVAGDVDARQIDAVVEARGNICDDLLNELVIGDKVGCPPRVDRAEALRPHDDAVVRNAHELGGFGVRRGA